MNRSSFFSLTFLLSASLLTTSCVKPEKGEDADATTFYIKDIRGNGITNQLEPGSVWKVPQKVKVTFQATVKERTSRVDLRGQKFSVARPDGVSFPDLTTDGDGNFSWDEDIPYNYFAGQSGWVEIKRTVIGQGANVGRQDVSIYVNPWTAGSAHREDAHRAVFMNREGTSDFHPQKVFSERQSAMAFAGALQGQAYMWAPESKVQAFVVGRSKYPVYRVKFISEFKIKTLDSSGVPHYDPMPDGDVLFRFQLMGENVGAGMDKHIELLKGGQTQWRGHVYDGKLQIEFKTQQINQPNIANLRAVVEVRPVGLHSDTLRSFTGVYDLGEGQVLKDDQTGTISQECRDQQPECEYAKILASADNVDELKKDGYVRDASPYLFTDLKLRFVSVQPGETTTQRTVIYSAKTCVTYINSGQPVRDTPMTIRYDPTMVQNTKYKELDDPYHPGKKIEDPNNPRMIRDEFDAEHPITYKRTNNEGCLEWNGYAFHHYYWPETFFFKTLKIGIGGAQAYVEPDGTHGTYPAFEQKLSFYLNPWDPGFTFGFDAQEFTAKFDGPKSVSRFFLGDYSYHTVRFLYHVDPFMNLEVQKWILLEIVPQVLRYSSISNARKAVEKLRDGIYLMKVAIEKSYLDPRDNSGWLLPTNPQLQAPIEKLGDDRQKPKLLRSKQYISTNETLVRVVDGVIIYPLELTMRDLRLMRVRSNFLIELENVDERLVQAYHVYRQRELNKAPIPGNVDPDKATLREKLDDFKKKLAANPNDEKIEEFLRSTTMPPELQAVEAQRKQMRDRMDAIDKLKMDKSDQEYARKVNEVVAATEALDYKVSQVQTAIRDELTKLKNVFDQGGEIGEEWDSVTGQSTGKVVALQAGQVVNDKFQLRDDVLKDLAGVLKVNDFSTVTLPKHEEVGDLDIFADKNSGLAPRTFVGPVIFLSNAYGDSMRATDNLDETGCNPAIGPDLLNEGEKALEEIYRKSPTLADRSIPFSTRDQNIYRYNKYFNAYDHLCDPKPKQVDDLIEDEKKLTRERDNSATAASLAYNFVDRFNMDFVSLTNEPLRKVDPKCALLDEQTKKYLNCPGSITNYLVPTAEVPVHYVDPKCQKNDDPSCQLVSARSVMTSQDLLRYMNQDWWTAGHPTHDPALIVSRLVYEAREKVSHDHIGHWEEKDIDHLIFGETTNPGTPDFNPRESYFTSESDEAVCNLLSNKIFDDVLEAEKKGILQEGHATSSLWYFMQYACWAKGPMHELKYRLDGKTGQYTFLGGLTLNINVGEGFSFGTSTGWSGGLDMVDMVSAGGGALGGTASKVVSAATKPVSLKYGESMGSSEGTSVSQSTYLVAQVEGMDVTLNRYEKCATLQLGRNAIDMMIDWGMITPVQAQEPNFTSILSRGIFVCQGETRNRNQPITVPESYFYFTQQFMDGDMLDQADLYNHPWLLALRGMRDYKVFIDRINAQEKESAKGFFKYVTGMLEPRRNSWALFHLAESYANTTPIFPGYYSVLRRGEKNIDQFALDQANPLANSNSQPILTKVDGGEDATGKGLNRWLSPLDRQKSQSRFKSWKADRLIKDGDAQVPLEAPQAK